MKKLIAVFTVLGLLSISTSAFAACGANNGRNSTTRAPSSGTAGTPNGGTAGTAAGAGMATGLPR